MKVENIAVSELKPLAVNVRKHSEAQIAEFIRSLNQFGQTRPFVVDEENNVLIGNGMLEAMKRAGFTECSIYRVSGLSEAEKKKLVLTDNKIYSLGADDFDNIEQYIKEISANGDFDIPGFSEDSLKALTRTADEILNDTLNYGKVENMTSATAQVATQSTQAQTVAPSEVNHTENASDVQAQQVTATTTTIQASEPAESVRTIICPSCGEIIRI